MCSSTQDCDPETDKFIQAVLDAFARLHFAAAAVLFSNDLAHSKAALDGLCEWESVNDPKQRPR